MKNRHIFFILCVFCLFSCTSENLKTSQNTANEPKTLSISKDVNYLPHKTTDALPGDYDVYLDYLKGTDYEIGISSHRDGALNNGRVISCISGISQVQPLQTKGTSKFLPNIVSYIDGIEVSQQSLSAAKTKGTYSDLLGSFGKTVTISFGKETATKSSSSESGSTDLYIPQEIEILAPYAASVEDLNPLCYYKDFVLRWNEDKNNDNGVLVLVEWNGGMILGDDIENTYVRRVATFPDTEETVLPERLFDGIPDTAYCELTLLRGNIDNVSDGEYTYKVLGETHQMISFILIREIHKS